MGGMMDRHLTWPLLIGAVLLSSACVATVEDYESLQQDVRKLRADVNAMKGEGFTGPEGVEGGTFRGTDMVARLEELAAETRMLQGQAEENNYRLSEIGLRLDETEIKVARLSGEPVRPGGTSRGGQAPTPSAVAPPCRARWADPRATAWGYDSVRRPRPAPASLRARSFLSTAPCRFRSTPASHAGGRSLTGEGVQRRLDRLHQGEL